MAGLTLEIVTPDGLKYRADCAEVVLPGSTGQIGILPGHRPLVAMLSAGEVQVKGPGPDLSVAEAKRQGTAAEEVAIDRGLVRVAGSTVSILTEAAVEVASIDLGAIQDARKRAEEALQSARDEHCDPAEIERLEAISRFAIAQELAKARKAQR